MDLKGGVVDSLEQEPPGRRVTKLFQALRRAARDAIAHGKDWRSVVDGSSSFSRIWRMFDEVDRKLFSEQHATFLGGASASDGGRDRSEV